MEEGAWTHLALTLERFAASAPNKLHSRNRTTCQNGHKRTRAERDKHNHHVDQDDATWYRQLSPAQHMALKKTAVKIFWPHPTETGASKDASVRMLRDLVDMLPRRDPSRPIVDDTSHTVHLDACASFQDMAQLAIAILLTDQERAKAREEAFHETKKDHVWELDVEKQKATRACQELLQARKEIRELKAKQVSMEKELGKVRAALNDARQLNRDHAFHVHHLRQNTRSVARHHAELICGHMRDVFKKERAYLTNETKEQWAKHFNITPSALDGLLELYRRVFTRLQVSYDASMDTAAIPPMTDSPKNDRTAMHASAPPPICNSPTYTPASYIPGHAGHNADIEAFLRDANT